jgi:hypothetical protein
MAASEYCNPVHPGYFADPFVWRIDDGWFAVGTGRHEAEGRWWLYYSVGHGDRRHQLRVAVSDRPLGPWLDVAALTDPERVPFAIDPHPFRDVDGRWYLFHARDFLDTSMNATDVNTGEAQTREVRAGTALVVSPLQGMTRLGEPLQVVARARCDWQRFAADRRHYDRVFDWHTLEGPCVLRHDECYWCLYSGGCWQDASYGVDFAVADSPLGPWSDAGAEHGPRVLRSVPGQVTGPGHCSVVTGPDDDRWLCYHAWDAARTARRLCIDRLRFTADGPVAVGPTWTPQPAPAARTATNSAAATASTSAPGATTAATGAATASTSSRTATTAMAATGPASSASKTR